MISGQAEPSVDFEVCSAVAFDVVPDVPLADFEVSFVVVVELAFDVPGEVVPDALLAVPCVVDEGVLLPGQMRQKGEGDGGRD